MLPQRSMLPNPPVILYWYSPILTTPSLMMSTFAIVSSLQIKNLTTMTTATVEYSPTVESTTLQVPSTLSSNKTIALKVPAHHVHVDLLLERDALDAQYATSVPLNHQ
jgi:hypothetical protein